METSKQLTSAQHAALCERIETLSIKEQQQSQIQPTGDTSSAIGFFKSTGLDLHEVLWAFALILDSTRTATKVTATVLSKVHNQDKKPSTIILHVAQNCGISENKQRCAAFRNYKEKLEGWISMCEEPSSDAIMNCCRGRISGYYRLAKKVFNGYEENNPFWDWKPTEEPLHIFARELKVLLGHINKSLKDNATIKNYDTHATLDKAWTFLKEHGKTFNELWTGIRHGTEQVPSCTSEFHGPQIRTRVCQYFKTIENLAKVPRAIQTFVGFWEYMASSGLRFEIWPIPSDGTAAIKSNNRKLPHCEMQLLQYFEGEGRQYKAETWNVIGCSKRPCYCCAFVINHGSDFTFRESHGKIYSPWPLPERYAHDSRLPAALRELDNALEKRISDLVKDTRKNHGHTDPDSPTSMDWPA